MSIQDKTLPLCTFLKHPECGLHLQVGAYVVPCGKKPWYCELFTLSEAYPIKSKNVKSLSRVRLCDLGLPGFWVFQARVLEWAAVSFSRGSSSPRDQTGIFCIADRRFTV